MSYNTQLLGKGFWCAISAALVSVFLTRIVGVSDETILIGAVVLLVGIVVLNVVLDR